jgi:hypothetical protein
MARDVRRADDDSRLGYGDASHVEVDRRFRGANDDGESTHLWNICLLLGVYTALYPRRLSPSYSPPQEPEISRTIHCFLSGTDTQECPWKREMRGDDLFWRDFETTVTSCLELTLRWQWRVVLNWLGWQWRVALNWLRDDNDELSWTDSGTTMTSCLELTPRRQWRAVLNWLRDDNYHLPRTDSGMTMTSRLELTLGWQWQVVLNWLWHDNE